MVNVRFLRQHEETKSRKETIVWSQQMRLYEHTQRGAASFLWEWRGLQRKKPSGTIYGGLVMRKLMVLWGLCVGLWSLLSGIVYLRQDWSSWETGCFVPTLLSGPSKDEQSLLWSHRNPAFKWRHSISNNKDEVRSRVEWAGRKMIQKVFVFVVLTDFIGRYCRDLFFIT